MTTPLIRQLAALLALAHIAGACMDASDPAPGDVPQAGFGKQGGAIGVDFLETMSVAANADYVSDAQSVHGINSRKWINVSSPYTLTIQYSANDIATCEDGGERLSQVLGTHSGTLGINVDKAAIQSDPTHGVVVNFTLTVGGSEYFLTTGRGTNSLVETATQSTVMKTGGFVRVVRDGESGGAWCPARDVFNGTNGIVDFEFMASK